MPKTSQPTSTPKMPSSPSAWEVRLARWWARSEAAFWNLLGVLTLVWALLTLLGLFNLTQGAWLTPWVVLLRRLFGWGAFLMVPALGVTGLAWLYRPLGRTLPLRWSRVIALEVAGLALCGLLSRWGGHDVLRAEQGLDGGIVGWGLAELLGLLLPGPLNSLVLGLAALLGFWWGSGLSTWIGQRLWGWATAPEVPPPTTSGPAPDPEEPAPPPKERARPLKRSPSLPPAFQKRLEIPSLQEESAPPRPRAEHLPPLSLLLREKKQQPDERTINLNAGLIEKTLAEFGIPAKVVGVRVGPTVTQYAVEPGYIERPGPDGEVQRQKVRVAQIAALRRDLALALAAERLRIQAPVPGRSYVGIEVPNSKASVVRLRPLLESEAFARIGSPLAVALGRDVSGRPVVADLAKMPHLLIAGTTGSGKSVCITAITTCLVMNNTPQDLRLVMIDPKMVELVRFNGLPHLMGKVETEIERILAALRWAVAEMERRYKLLEQARARDILAYNLKMRRKKGEPLPYIVVVVDELADLMMNAPAETEHLLVRLAQLARATGIHLVVATQRPSTDVVTGLIKANFPARIAFAVASGVDSRVILDTPGAEHLLGRGDMLFLPPDAPAPIRAQGALVTEREIERVVAFWSQQSEGAHPEPPPWEDLLAQQAARSAYDPLIERAAELVIRTQKASATMLQRRLRVGYPRAARLIEQLEALGVVGPAEGSRGEREVLYGPEETFSLTSDDTPDTEG